MSIDKEEGEAEEKECLTAYDIRTVLYWYQKFRKIEKNVSEADRLAFRRLRRMLESA